MPDLTTGVRTVTVERPVIVPCIREADIPQPPATAMPDPPTADVKRFAAGASIDLRQQVAYSQRLRAALIACSNVNPAASAAGAPITAPVRVTPSADGSGTNQEGPK